MSLNTYTTPHRVIIFRHGLATHSTSGYGDQILTAELLPEGIPAIERMAQYLKPIKSRIHFASPVLRCRQTVEIITREAGKFFRFDSRLSEYLGEVHQEEFAAFAQRTAAALKNILAEADQLAGQSSAPQQPLTLMICTHGAVVASIKHLLLTGEFTQNDLLDFTLPGELMDIQNGQCDVKSFNS